MLVSLSFLGKLHISYLKIKVQVFQGPLLKRTYCPSAAKSWFFCFGEAKVPWYWTQNQCILCILFWVSEQTCLMVSTVFCSLRVQKAACLVYSWAHFDRNFWVMFSALREECTLLSPSQLTFSHILQNCPFKFFLFCWGSCSSVTLSRCSAWPHKLKTDAQESSLFKTKPLMSRIIK